MSGGSGNPAGLYNLDNPAIPVVGLMTDALDNETKFLLDRFGYLTQHTDALGNKTDYVRDANGLVTKQTDPDPDGAGGQPRPETEFEYDANGNLVEIIHPDETVATWVYDMDLNRPTLYTDELDRETAFTYDEFGNVETVTDPLGAVTAYALLAATVQRQEQAFGKLEVDVRKRLQTKTETT